MRADEILSHIGRLPNQTAGYKQLVRELGIRNSGARRGLHEMLRSLVNSNRLLEAGRDRYTLPGTAASRQNLVSGRLSMHRDGYGFVTPDDPALREKISGDIYIAPPATLNAMHGDKVLVEIGPIRPDGRAEGRVLRISDRRHQFVVGKFRHGQRSNYVEPLDEKINQVVIIAPGDEVPPPEWQQRYGGASTAHRVIGDEAKPHHYDSLDNVVVNVEITDFPKQSGQNPKGRVVEILGYEDDFGVDVEIVIRKHHLPHVFPDDALVEARELAADRASFEAEVATRTDFRDLPIVTIDGETARDFDDAVMVRIKENGNYELHVHIADVAQYVTPDSPLDDEARLRGNSVYFPDRAIPMLPLELSTDLCSLRPQVDRLVMSCVMELDHHGEVLGYEMYEGVIRSAARMTYNKVQKILDGDAELRAEYAALVPEFEGMEKLARILNRKRQKRGSIDFDLPEPVIEFDEQGMMQGVTRSIRLFAHRLIEEFMLAANECVAEYLEQRGIASIYRIHEKPDAKKVFEFELLAATFGYSLGVGALPIKRINMKAERRDNQRRGRGRQAQTHEIPQDVHITPHMYQKLAAKIAGTPEEQILSYLMLRSLKQAKYSEKNEGHFALAAPTYTHFTSPIRRYPDLIVHRLLKEVLRNGEHAATKGRKPSKRATIEIIPESELHDIAEHSSETERAADDAERDLMEWKKAKFMIERIGEEFPGLIVSVTKFGFFVELFDLFVEGLVPLQTLEDDRYSFHENTREIIGERWGKIYRIGDRVRVLVDKVDPMSHKINFAVLEEEHSFSKVAKKKSAKRKKSERPEAVAKRAKAKAKKRR